jgi:hypothetical protein
MRSDEVPLVGKYDADPYIWSCFWTQLLTLELPSRSHKVSGTSFGNYDEGKDSERIKIYLDIDFQKHKNNIQGALWSSCLVLS